MGEGATASSHNNGLALSKVGPVRNSLKADLGAPCNVDVEGIIARTLPTEKGTRHQQLFELTRELVAVFGDDPMSSVERIKEIVVEWYRRALDMGVSTMARAD